MVTRFLPSQGSGLGPSSCSSTLPGTVGTDGSGLLPLESSTGTPSIFVDVQLLKISLATEKATIPVITGIVAFSVAKDIFKSWTSTNIEGVPVEDSNGSKPDPSVPTVPGNVELQDEGPKPDPWEGRTRVTILVMGLDYRDWEAGDPPRSDTMVLFTLDPLTNTAGMLSIPRDMWVNIPGHDYAKINTAYFLGEAENLPGGGPGLAVETVQQFLGVPINYYAQVDFNAFVRFIDELGGVNITVEEPMTIAILG